MSITRREWGYIYFKGGPHCEYRGSLLLSAIPDEYMEAGIESVKAAGGWSRMDYRIEINKKEEAIPKDHPYAHNVKVVINSGKQWVSRKKNAEAASGTIPRSI